MGSLPTSIVLEPNADRLSNPVGSTSKGFWNEIWCGFLSPDVEPNVPVAVIIATVSLTRSISKIKDAFADVEIKLKQMQVNTTTYNLTAVGGEVFCDTDNLGKLVNNPKHSLHCTEIQ